MISKSDETVSLKFNFLFHKLRKTDCFKKKWERGIPPPLRSCYINALACMSIILYHYDKSYKVSKTTLFNVFDHYVAYSNNMFFRI